MFDDDVERYPDPKGAEAEFYSRYQNAKAEKILMDEARELAETLGPRYEAGGCLTWVDTIRGVPSACVELKKDVVISLSFAAYRDQAARRFMPWLSSYVRYPAGLCRWTLFEKSEETEQEFTEVMGGVSHRQEVLTIISAVFCRSAITREVLKEIREQLTALAHKDNQQSA